MGFSVFGLVVSHPAASSAVGVELSLYVVSDRALPHRSTLGQFSSPDGWERLAVVVLRFQPLDFRHRGSTEELRQAAHALVGDRVHDRAAGPAQAPEARPRR